VIDGDTIAIHGNHIRLNGIDAPERDQTCFDANTQRTPCGQRASTALREIVGTRSIACDITGHDVHGRILATCFNDNGDDIGKLMVQRGHALPFRRYSSAYIADDNQARDARLGMWAGRFVDPWTYRRTGN